VGRGALRDWNCHPEERSDEGSLRLGKPLPAAQLYTAREILRFAQDDSLGGKTPRNAVHGPRPAVHGPPFSPYPLIDRNTTIAVIAASTAKVIFTQDHGAVPVASPVMPFTM